MNDILKEDEFKEHLKKLKLSEKEVQQSIRVVKEAEEFLAGKDGRRLLNHASTEDLHKIIDYFSMSRSNTWENLLVLLRYSRVVGNRELEVGLLELLDGSDVLNNLSKKIKKTWGEKKHGEIFGEIELPPLGTFSADKPKTTKRLMERLETVLGEDGCKEILLTGPHAAPKKAYLSERKKFLESKDVDDFLRKRHKEYVDELEEHVRNGTLYFTQEIDEEVLDYVRKTPTCQNGVREDDIIFVTKIPYMAKQYLKEKDEKMKRYFYCHCPWVREAIKSEIKISSNFCYCSAAFEKRPWDVIFNQPVKADVVETVLKGDMICRFAIHIPKKFLNLPD